MLRDNRGTNNTVAAKSFYASFTSNVVNHVQTSVRTLLKSSNAMIPSPRSRDSNVVKGVQQCKTAVDRGRTQWTAWVWMLLKSITFWYRTVRHVRTLPEVMDSVRMLSTVDGVWTHVNACEGISENAALILDCWPLHMAEHFGTVYHIVSYRDIVCSIISYPSFSPTAISCHHYHCLYMNSNQQML